MASDKELNAQAEDFLNAMAPRPVPPASRKKHTGIIEEEKPITNDEDAFLNRYILNRSNSICDKPSRQVLINNDLHLRLREICIKSERWTRGIVEFSQQYPHRVYPDP